jgi:hypothetical protein
MLSYRITETSFRREVVDSVKKVYGIEYRKGLSLQSPNIVQVQRFLDRTFPIVYDTGTVISFLP